MGMHLYGLFDTSSSQISSKNRFLVNVANQLIPRIYNDDHTLSQKQRRFFVALTTILRRRIYDIV